MKIFEKIKNYAVAIFRTLTLKNMRSSLVKMDYVNFSGVLILNVISSIAKILAPATLAQAVEVIANTGEEPDRDVTSEAKQLLYLSMALTAWANLEGYVKKMLLKNIERSLIRDNVCLVVKASHQMSYHQLLTNKPLITKLLLDVINNQSKIPAEVLTSIQQTLLDLFIGTTYVWVKYGGGVGGQFLAYFAFDIFCLSYFVDLVTKQTSKKEEADNQLMAFMDREFQTLNYSQTVRLFGHESLELDLTKDKLERYLKAKSEYQRAENLAQFIKYLPILLANFIPVLFMLKEKASLKDLDDFVFLFSYINVFGSNMSNLSKSMKTCLQGNKSIETMMNLVEGLVQPSTILECTNPEQATLMLHQDTVPYIEFNNVTFYYPNATTPTLDGVSFKIFQGETIGIIGESSAGKSTVVKLLLGLYQCHLGKITINGQNINTIPKSELARRFCLVPQQAELFEKDSLSYNVLYGIADNEVLKSYKKKEEQDAKSVPSTNYQAINYSFEALSVEVEHLCLNSTINKALQDADLGDLVEKANSASVPELSGGQRQRVSIARALARSSQEEPNSSVFIFDEFTSSLDAFTERNVLNNAKKITQGSTTIMITHRLSTVAHVDHLIALEKGRVVEQGAPDKLLEEDSYFKKCWEVQRGDVAIESLIAEECSTNSYNSRAML